MKETKKADKKLPDGSEEMERSGSCIYEAGAPPIFSPMRTAAAGNFWSDQISFFLQLLLDQVEQLFGGGGDGMHMAVVGEHL